jgi:hypothetical protein
VALNPKVNNLMLLLRRGLIPNYGIKLSNDLSVPRILHGEQILETTPLQSGKSLVHIWTTEVNIMQPINPFLRHHRMFLS